MQAFRPKRPAGKKLAHRTANAVPPIPINSSMSASIAIVPVNAIYRRIEEDLKLTHVAAHVGTEGNELADRMAMLGAQRKEKKLRPYQETIDIPTLLKMRAG